MLDVSCASTAWQCWMLQTDRKTTELTASPAQAKLVLLSRRLVRISSFVRVKSDHPKVGNGTRNCLFLRIPNARNQAAGQTSA